MCDFASRLRKFPDNYIITTLSSLRSKVPAFLNVVDIAGLVKGAHEGQGLGNAFLSNIGACDALFHVVSKFFSQLEFVLWYHRKGVEVNVNPLTPTLYV